MAIEPPAARQLTAWLEAFNSGVRAQMLEFHARHCSYSVASAAVGDIDREERLRRGTGGFELKKLESLSPTSVAATLKERRSDQYARVELEVANTESHPVTRLEIRPTPTPDEFLTAEERKARTIDDARRRTLIDQIARQLQDFYVFPDAAERMNAALRRHLAEGDYDAITDARAFAETLTKDLRKVSRDLHLRVRFGRRPAALEATRAEALESARAANFGFGPSARLTGNVAHLVIDSFPDADSDEARVAIGTSMSKVSDADALLIDLRQNGGGSPRTVAFVISYLFGPTPVHLNDMYSRAADSTEPSWTLRDVPGTRFGGGKPVYVLTSKRTFSGGEEFAYDLQSLRRAKIVGEATAGAAHPGGPRPLDDWFTIDVPWGRPINPITKTNWEGVGVVPDIVVPAASAVDEAHRRALADIAAARGARVP